MEDKTELKISKHELDLIKEYKEGYYCLMDYWDSISDEEKPMVNKRLNDIFKLNQDERSE